MLRCRYASSAVCSDNVEARQWLNATLVDLVRFDSSGGVELASVVPLIDGGTEGFGGQARVFLPRLTSCFECSLPSMPPQQGFAVCTIRNIPRLPEHCILYALKVEWPLLQSFTSPTDYQLYERAHAGDEHSPAAVSLDKDDAAHMTWLYDRAQRRALQFGIGGVTYALTMQVVKNIIPAIASTNALIAAACVNECWKVRTNAALRLDNYFMSATNSQHTHTRSMGTHAALGTLHNIITRHSSCRTEAELRLPSSSHSLQPSAGWTCLLRCVVRYMGGQQTGTHCETIQYKQNDSCAVCRKPHILRLDGSRHAAAHCTLSADMSLQQLIDCIESELAVTRASVSKGGAVLYLTTLHSDYQSNLSKPVSELQLSGGDILTVNASGTTGKVLLLF